MRYDIESGKIQLTVKEMVTIYRRGISPTLPLDEDEPSAPTPTRRAIFNIAGSSKGVPLIFGFKSGEYDFELIGKCEKIEGCHMTVIRPIDSPPKKPKREEDTQVRGEASVLAYMYAALEELGDIELEIVYLNEKSGESDTRVTKIGVLELKKFFFKCAAALEKYAAPEIERVTKRLPTLRGLKFPYAKVREGQGELVRSVYRTLAKGTTLYACAPTGTGKTVSMIYPALRLIGEGKCEKLFYLTPKATTAEAAIDCLRLFEEEGAIIRAIRLYSKERSCPNRLVCRTRRALCPLAECNHLADAALALWRLQKTVVTLADIQAAAKQYSVCPHELELAYSELCDVVICDINYLFDPKVYIRRFFTTGGRYSFLVDEAHNLAERAREMYSASLSIPAMTDLIANPLLPENSPVKKHWSGLVEGVRGVLYSYVKEEIRRDKDDCEIGATHLTEPPEDIYDRLAMLKDIIEEDIKLAVRQSDEYADERVSALRSVYYDLSRFLDVFGIYDGGYRTFIFYNNGKLECRFYAVDPSTRISEMVARGHGAVFFSATLAPLDYYKSVLGGDGTADTLEVLSPFAPEALSVSIMDKISTRYSERERTLPAVSRAIAAALSPRKGNYMVFAPSFEYLEQIARSFRETYPKIAVLEQRRDMTAAEKERFLDAFREKNDNYLVGFCVMGGAYSEGIDLAGESLIGAVVVGIGMPSLSYEREAMAEYYEEKMEAGRLYAYIYPGMNKVLQAAGRVIRREDDRGIIVLIDDRFDDPIYKKVIPSLWRGMAYVSDVGDLNSRIKDFWREVEKEKRSKG